MPVSQIPINQGAFKPDHDKSLRNNAYALDLINLMIDVAGGNFDRPTLETWGETTSTNVIGLSKFGSYFVAVTADRKVWALDTSATLTDITGVSLPGVEKPVFTNDGTNIYIVGGGTPIYWDGDVATNTIALGGTPPSFSHISYLDGYLIGNVSGTNQIRYSDFETPGTWTGTNIFTNNAAPDNVVASTVAQREFYAVGTDSIEIWQNIGTSPVPFARSFIWQYGTKAPYSVHAVDNSVFMLTKDRQILRFSGRSVMRMSEAIEEELFSYAQVTDCVAGSFYFKGSIHVIFFFPNVGSAWSVDLKNNQWTEWKGWNNGYSKFRGQCVYYDKDTKDTLCGDFSTGDVWKFSETTKTDANQTFKRQRTFSWRDGGANVRKQANFLRVNLKRDVAAASGTTPQTNPKLELRWKDEDREWSDFRQASLGVKGTQKGYAEFRRLGMYRNRKYDLQISDPVELNITSIETDEEVMAS